MNKHPETPIRITTFGMDQHARRMLDVVFKGPAHNAYVLVEENLAEAAIFDMDSFGALELWEDYREVHPHLPTLILSLNEQHKSGALFVKKPVQVARLLDGLEGISSQVRAARESVAMMVAPLTQDKHGPGNGAARKPIAATPGELSPGVGGAARILSDAHSHSHRGYMEDALCGNHDDIDSADEEALERISYDPERRLQSVFEKALKVAESTSQPVSLLGLSAPFYILPGTAQVQTAINEETLRTLSMLPLLNKSIAIKTLSKEEWKQESKASNLPLTCYCLRAYHWKLALWSSRGRVPKGTPLNKPVILLHWPNLTRLLLTPHALQIAALWIEQSCSLTETARILNIPQRHVFAFYSATHALKLAFPDRRSDGRGEQEAEEIEMNMQANKHPRRSLLRRILEHLS